MPEDSPKKPKTVGDYVGQAIGFQNDGDFQSAEQLFAKAIELGPDHAQTYLFRAALYKQFGEIEKARSDYNKAIEIAPSDEMSYISRAYFCAELGLQEDALKDFSKAIALDPQKSHPYYFRSEFHIQITGRMDDALSDLNKVLELSPNNIDAYCRRGAVYGLLNRLDEGITDYNKAISLQPNDANIHMSFGRFFERAGQMDNALLNFNRAIEVSPWDILYLQRAGFYERRGRVELAIADCTKAIELSEGETSQHITYVAYITRAELYKEQLIPEKIELALKDAQKASDINPLYYKAPFLAGLIRLDLHRYGEAFQSFDAALDSQFEKGQVAIQLLIKFYLAWAKSLFAYYQVDDLDKARAYFSEAKSHLEKLPANSRNTYNILYIERLLDAYLLLIPMDNKLKDVLSEPDKLPQRTETLYALMEFFSSMFRLSDGMLVEIDFLIEAKRDICALLLPLTHPQAIKPEKSEDILENIQGNLEFLKYEHTNKIIKILKDNRQRLEQDRPFSKELAKMGDMADGMMTFSTSGSAISGMMGDLIKVPEEEIQEITIDPQTGKEIPKIIRKYRFVHKSQMDKAFAISDTGMLKPSTKIQLKTADIRSTIMKIRQAGSIETQPTAGEITFRFLRNYQGVRIDVQVKDKWAEVGVFNPVQLGLVHKQSKEPTEGWLTIVNFANMGDKGLPSPSGDNKPERQKKQNAFRQQISRLNQKLQELLGISDRAINYNESTGRYKSNLILVKAREDIE